MAIMSSPQKIKWNIMGAHNKNIIIRFRSFAWVLRGIMVIFSDCTDICVCCSKCKWRRRPRERRRISGQNSVNRVVERWRVYFSYIHMCIWAISLLATAAAKLYSSFAYYWQKPQPTIHPSTSTTPLASRAPPARALQSKCNVLCFSAGSCIL